MSKPLSLNDFPKDVQDIVYQILANAAMRNAKAMKDKGETVHEIKTTKTSKNRTVAMNKYLVPAAQNQPRTQSELKEDPQVKYPLKPEGMSDEAYERTQRLIARLELKYQDKHKEDTP